MSLYTYNLHTNEKLREYLPICLRNDAIVSSLSVPLAVTEED